MLEDVLNLWARFESIEYSYEILMGIGGLLIIIAALKIIRSSLKVLFWVVLGAIGFASFSYGMNRGDSQMTRELDGRIDIADIIRDGKEDVLRVLCEKLPGYLPPAGN